MRPYKDASGSYAASSASSSVFEQKKEAEGSAKQEDSYAEAYRDVPGMREVSSPEGSVYVHA